MKGKTMLKASDHPATLAAIRVDLGAIFVSLELGKSSWMPRRTAGFQLPMGAQPIAAR
jgi:hypothetical protein